jgi:hypothetical protein
MRLNSATSRIRRFYSSSRSREINFHVVQVLPACQVLKAGTYFGSLVSAFLKRILSFDVAVVIVAEGPWSMDSRDHVGLTKAAEVWRSLCGRAVNNHSLGCLGETSPYCLDYEELKELQGQWVG